MYNITKIRPFSQKSDETLFEEKRQIVTNEINNQSADYILKVEEQDYKNYLQKKYSLEHLLIDFSSEKIDLPQKRIVDRPGRGKYETYKDEVYEFKVTYTFTGSEEFFEVRPSSFIMRSGELYIDVNNKSVWFFVALFDLNPEKFNLEKEGLKRGIFANYNPNVNYAEKWNNRLRDIIAAVFLVKKEKHKKENQFYEQLNISVKDSVKNSIAIPLIEKKHIPQPQIDKTKKFSTYPTMTLQAYEDILKTILDTGKQMEIMPSLYKNKDEPGIRDIFLLYLSNRYKGFTASGETHNRSGKTDIILRHEDGTNLFVAECKIWSGISDLFDAISQLLSYLTWDDSKVSLLVFVKEKQLTKILTKIKDEIINHTHYKTISTQKDERSLSYVFGLPQDEDKNVLLEVIVFHFDKWGK